MQMRQKIRDYMMQSIRDRGSPPTLQDIRTALKTTSKIVISYTLDRLEADGWIERDLEEPRGMQPTEQGQQARNEQGELSRRTHPHPPPEAVNAAIKAIDDLIDSCDPQAIDPTLEGFIRYLHARQEVIRAQRMMFGEGYSEDE
jgi:SOS-response transcriptional repressor LexA